MKKKYSTPGRLVGKPHVTKSAMVVPTATVISGSTIFVITSGFPTIGT